MHLVKFLIDAGAELLSVNADGNMPYDLCEDDTTLSYIENEMARRGVTQELIDETRSQTERQMLSDLMNWQTLGGDLETRDHSNATPLHIASANGYLSVVEFLLDHHASTEVVDDDLWQPLHAAACWGHLEVVEMLAQNGANINAKVNKKSNVFNREIVNFYTIFNFRREMARLLLTFVRIPTSKRDFWSSKNKDCNWDSLGSVEQGRPRPERNPSEELLCEKK